jgi:hypothetical protein
MKILLTLMTLALLGVSHGGAGSPKRLWTIGEILEDTKYRTQVVIKGEISKSYDFDFHLLDDGTGVIMVNGSHVNQHFGVGDEVVIYGRYIDSEANKPKDEEIRVIKFATSEKDPPVDQWIAKYGKEDEPQEKNTGEISAQKNIKQPISTAPSDIETRLKKLSDLKEKGLITEEEYQQQKKRILNEL